MSNYKDPNKVYETGSDDTAWNSKVLRNGERFDVQVFDADGDRRPDREDSFADLALAVAFADKSVLRFSGREMSKDIDQGALADKAFAEYEFGEGVTVTDTSGWEYTTPGHERTQKVYVETEREDDGPAPRWALNFTVRFDPATGALSEAYAMDEKGQTWGTMPTQREVPNSIEPPATSLNHDQQEALAALRAALAQATDCGLFDELAADVSHPDRINAFCDDVREFAGAQGLSVASPGAYADSIANREDRQTPRVLVVVSGGVAEPTSDPGVDVEVFDWDNYKDDPEGTGGVSAEFADLAEPLGIPVASADESAKETSC